MQPGDDLIELLVRLGLSPRATGIILGTLVTAFAVWAYRGSTGVVRFCYAGLAVGGASLVGAALLGYE